MSNRLVLVENRSYARLEASRQAQLEASLRRVCGARLARATSLTDEMRAPHFQDCVFVLPVCLPGFLLDVPGARLEMERLFPARSIFGVFFVLFPEEGFSPESFLDDFWIETLDAFYDQAVPVGFSVLHDQHPAVQGFEVVAGISALFRDIDSLGELRRIASELGDLEERIRAIEETEDTRR